MRRGSDRVLYLIAALSFFSYWIVLHTEKLDGKDAPSNVLKTFEKYASSGVPNYKKIWYARSLLWRNADLRGANGLNEFGYDLFTKTAFDQWGVVDAKVKNLSIPLEDALHPWDTYVCTLDSDNDGFTNGQELGDPCCIWKPGMEVAWSFHLTHPARRGETPNAKALEMLQGTNCKDVEHRGYYLPSDADFFSWYYEEHFSDVEYGRFGAKVITRLAVLLAHVGVLTFWVREKRLWRDFMPKSLRSHESLSRLRLFAVVVCSYLLVDLASAFVHAFLDNCYLAHPIVGHLCMAFQHHHYHPRSLSIAPVLYWITHTLVGALPLTSMYAVLGLHYQLPREAQVGVALTAVFWPMTYVFHNMAHLPESHRPMWFQALQAMGLALGSEAHFVHHRQIDNTWSSMAGIMDFVPNFLVQYFYDRQDAISTWTILYILLLGPWYCFFMYYVILRRGYPAPPTSNMVYSKRNQGCEMSIPP